MTLKQVGAALLVGGVAAAAAAKAAKARDALGEPESGLARPVDRKRTILVTGAASGIGLNTVRLFLAKGWFVGAFDLDEEALRKALGDRSASSVVLGRVDVCDGDSCKSAVETFLRAAPGGAMDALFNCAGILTIEEFERIPLARQQLIIDVNCKGVINMTLPALPALKEARGCIITMASGSSVAGIPYHVTYAATKAFVYSFTEGLRTELSPQGVRVCDVSVNYVATPMTATQQWSKGSFLVKNNFATASSVAGTVWDALHKATRFNEHFYVDDVTAKTFTIVALSRALGLSYHTKLIAESMQAKI
ncbi:Dehydrogenase/reductase SDR family member 7B [Hondaea fermentalgiana]|uniref:Dehydrogenase/reductase SDR family member 7B n=1 Tax=Hondaea fermentalgiana TaxID=2315210 RepID=A0A2R5GMB4_9STRA|nr:Dehydrogenase/reductase SDR family member 7B [Hondaea fermentalgiana]|eukprot:GBG30878.1 Dehydrogenase/reductase SDR family member 7B [Hondaea fermentalgiana]